MRRWLLMALLLAVALGAAWWLTRRDGTRPSGAGAAVPADAAAVASPSPSPAAPAPPSTAGKVKRVSPEQRRDLAARIQAAHAARKARAALAAAGTATAEQPPALDPADLESPDQMLRELIQLMPDLQAQVTECQQQHAPQVTGFKAKLTMTGDPDIGTVIDASELEPIDGAAPLSPAFDDCVRDRLQTLELPPIASTTQFSASIVFDLTAADDE